MVMTLGYHRRVRHGMGDWQGDIAAAVAGDELNKLTSAIFGLNDSITSAIESSNQILAGYRSAKAELASATQKFGPVTSQDSGAYSAALAWTGAIKAVKIFARQAQTLAELGIVFSDISAQLQKAGLAQDADSVSTTLYQLNRFVIGSDALFAAVPEYTGTKQQIIQAFSAELKMWGVSPNAYSDPRWFAAFVKAADKVVPLEGRPSAPGELSNMGVGMGQLGNPMPMAIVALLWVIAIAAATVTLMYGISKTLDALNSEAITARELILQRDREKEALRLESIRAGKSQTEINDQMREFDMETHRQVGDIPKSPLAGLLLPIGLAVGGLFAVFVVPKLLEKL